MRELEGSLKIINNTGVLQYIFKGLVFTLVIAVTAVVLILFTSSVLAEIIRGGLNSVAQGQFEAGRSQGFHTVQIMLYIVLPQAYRNIVPTLLSQVVTTIKDSSYLANVAVIELMARVRQIMNVAYQYNSMTTTNVSDVFVLFGFAALLYFIINFTLSCAVRTMQKRRRRPAAQTVRA